MNLNSHISKPVQKNNAPTRSLFFQPKPATASSAPKVQRQKAGNKEEDKPSDATAKDPLVLTLPSMEEIDYLGINETLHYRGVLLPSSYSDDATTEWLRQHKFYKSFRAGNIAEKVLKAPVLRLLDIKAPGGDWDAWLANQTTPKAVGSAFQRDNRVFNDDDTTKPFIIMLPAFKHDLLKKEKAGPRHSPLEQEADEVAEKVMQMPAGINNTFFKPSPVLSQTVTRKCAACEPEEKNISRKAVSPANAGSESRALHQTLQSTGQPLDPGTRDFMESRFGYDFAKVQIHTDSTAQQSSADINALAYAHGYHIAFGAGQYQPDSNTGKQLLAHELAHVVQQNQGNIPAVQTKPTDKEPGKYDRTPPGKGAFTQAEYDAWNKRHSRADFYNGGSFETAAFYKRYTASWFWSNGYFYAGSAYGGFKGAYREIWLSDKENGKEFSVFRGDVGGASGTQPATTIGKSIRDTTENPPNIDPHGDFESMFGEEIRSKKDAHIMGGKGYAIQYGDGTIVFYPENGEQVIYKAKKGADEIGFDIYDENGSKLEGITIGITIEDSLD